MSTPIVVTEAGILAGEKYLQQHTDEFNYFAGQFVPHMCDEFVKELLTAVFQAEGIQLEMLERLSCREPSTLAIEP